MDSFLQPAATLRGVTRRYGKTTALRDVDLDVQRGELLAVLGPNGAGKTTAIRLLLGLAKPDGGEVRVLGHDPRHAPARRRIGAMLQVGKVPETLRVREHLDLFRSYYPNPMPVAEAVEAAGLQGLEGRLFGALSGGQRQRVLFALAICGNPELVFLDEPTVGLDVAARRLVWEQIRRLVQQGRTVVLTTHHLEEADALADRVAVLQRGSVVALGTASEIKSRVSRRTIRCSTQLPLGEIQAIPQVERVVLADGRTEIHTVAPESVLRALLARDAGLSDLEVAQGSLEDAFLSIVESESARNEEAVA